MVVGMTRTLGENAAYSIEPVAKENSIWTEPAWASQGSGDEKEAVSLISTRTFSLGTSLDLALQPSGRQHRQMCLHTPTLFNARDRSSLNLCQGWEIPISVKLRAGLGTQNLYLLYPVSVAGMVFLSLPGPMAFLLSLISSYWRYKTTVPLCVSSLGFGRERREGWLRNHTPGSLLDGSQCPLC